MTDATTSAGPGTAPPDPDADLDPAQASGQPTARDASRYGRRARRRRGTRAARWTGPALAALALAASLAVAVVAYRNLGNPGITGSVTAFTTADDHVDISLVVVRDRPRAEVTCTLRARSRDGTEVGYAQVPITPGNRRVALDYRLSTTARPVTGELLGCHYGS